MKIAIAQIGTDPGKIQQNKEKVLKYIEEAKKQKADLVVFPELTLPGYAAMDLFLSDSYVEENITALREITKSTEGIKAIVGFVDIDQVRTRPDKKRLRYNSVAVIENKTITAIRDKSLLPEYDIFMEKRYFATSRRRDPVIIDGKKVGLQICEDIYTWGYPINLVGEYAEQGIDLIINVSASPFSAGKLGSRLKWFKAAQEVCKVPILYANTVGSYDGYEGEVVFDGRSVFVNERGSIVAQGAGFKEELVLVDTEADKVLISPVENTTKDIWEALVFGIKEYSRRSGFKKCVIGLSGGVDSALVACLAVHAFGKENVTLVAMPTEYSSPGTRHDAANVAFGLGAKFIDLSIQPLFDQYKAECGKLLKDEPSNGNDTTIENIQSRIRGTLLMAYANRTGSLLLNTGNKTELALGYCTLYGDMNGALAPLADISKERVYELVRYANTLLECVPQSLIDRAPSAELKPNQTDEAGLGFPYSILSPLCDDLIESDLTDEELNKKYPAQAIETLRKKIKLNEFKRRQSPPGIRVTEKAFGVGRRIPISY